MSENLSQTTAFIARLPKVELHIHLEGSVRPETLRELAQSKGREQQGVEDWIAQRTSSGFRYHDFRDFINAFTAVTLLLETPRSEERRVGKECRL